MASTGRISSGKDIKLEPRQPKPKRRRLHLEPAPSKNLKDEKTPDDAMETEGAKMMSFPIGDRAGLIVSLSVRNIMCHSHNTLECQPDNKKLLWIGGHNGSGKSAIFAALNLALGGQASSLDRGRRLADFIKNDESEAVLEVVLKNVGELAYRPADYGSSIRIQRTLKSSGGSTLKIYNNTTGQLVGRTTLELSAIRDAFNIQLDNPLFWMNQQRSRTFLAAAKPEKLYELFFKATDLERTDRDYQGAQKFIKSLNVLLAGLEEELKSQRDVTRHWRKQHDEYAGLEVNKIRLDLQTNYAKQLWFEVVHQERELKDLNVNLATLEGGMREETEKKENKVLDLQNCETEKQELLEQVDKAKKDGADAQKQKETAADTLKQAEQALTTIKSAQMEKESSVVKSRCEIRAYSEEIEHERRRMSGADAAEQRKIAIEEVRSRLRNFIDERRPKLAASNDTIRRLQEISRQRSSEFEMHRTEMQTVKYAKEKEANQLQYLQQPTNSADDQKIARFGGRQAVEVSHLIQQNRRRFNKMPLGPIGCYVQVKEPQWAPTVEFCLGSLLNSFVADNNADRTVLLELCRLARSNAPVITQRFMGRAYDVGQKSASNRYKYKTVLDMITVSNDDALNVLIDQRSIENALLCEDETDARNFMRNCFDRCVNEALVATGQQIYPGHKYRCYAISLPAYPKLISSSDQQKVVLEKSIEANLEKIAAMERNLPQLKTAADRAGRELAQQTSAQSAVQRELNEALTDDDRLKRELEALIGVSATDIDQTLAVKLQCERRMQQQMDELSALNDRIGVAVERVDDARVRQRVAEDACQAARRYAADIKVHASSLDRRKDEAERAKQLAERKIAKTVTKIAEYQGRIADAQAKLDVLSAAMGAQELPPKPEIARGDTMASIKGTVLHLERKLETAERLYGDFPSIKARYEQEQANYNTVRHHVHEAREIKKVLDKAMAQRQTKFSSVRNNYAHSHTMRFQHVINLKRLEGKLIYDHAARTLTPMIQVRDDDGPSTGPLPADISPSKRHSGIPKCISSLSGGERSFGLISFLLSLWDVTDSPFQLVDECDIFMDATTRKFVDDTIAVFACQTEKQKQYLVFSPHPLDMTRWPQELQDRTMYSELPLIRNENAQEAEH